MNRVRRWRTETCLKFGCRLRLNGAVWPLLALGCWCAELSWRALDSERIGGYWLAGCLAAMAGTIALQWLPWIIGVDRLGWVQRAGILAVQALLTWGPSLVLHTTWAGIGGFLVSSALLLTRPPVSWLLVLVAAAGSAATTLLLPAGERGIGDALHQAVVTTLAGLVLFGVGRLGSLLTKARDSTDDVVALAVAREQLRFSRDLHDLLSYGLSVITIKSELAHRLADGQPVRTQQELEDVARIARQVLADTRAMAHGYRTMSLKCELESAVSVVEGTGRTVTLDVLADISPGAIPAETGNVLAAVLREGVTNMLRHSRGRQCRITIEDLKSSITLTVWNDGPVSSTVTDASAGAGLDNLSARMNAVGGHLEVEYADDWFALIVRIPSAGERSGQMAAATRR